MSSHNVYGSAKPNTGGGYNPSDLHSSPPPYTSTDTYTRAPVTPQSNTSSRYGQSERTPLVSNETDARTGIVTACICQYLALAIFVVLAVFYLSGASLPGSRDGEPNIPRARWTQLEGEDRCVAYETRWYKATLVDLPWYLNWRHCMLTPLTIHDVTYNSPERCEYTKDGIIGHFLINHDGPRCRTYWSNFNDKGCAAEGSRRRRIEAMLEGLQPDYDWFQMCATTPADIRGEHITPTYCQARDKWHWMAGVWEIEDGLC